VGCSEAKGRHMKWGDGRSQADAVRDEMRRGGR